MIEKIENVELNLDCYTGHDLYSDGTIEDEILEFVKDSDQKDYGKFIELKKNWAVLYHLSPLRQNIVMSVSITKEDDVLEIGAGCGAITGRLCEMARNVDCIELSKKRSLINAYRNKNRDNLKIMVGNFETIEKNITKQYDVITLIGVYEYAASYISSSSPYQDFIKIAMKHLKPNGRLIVAIENRLGLKYFAGCREDHVGMYFEGLEGYTNTKGVMTFSKEELIKQIKGCGYDKIRFLYPYPDYKFPISIYSDEYLPKKGELNMNVLNMDQSRQLLFDESKFYDSIADSNLFPIFSNSYLLEIRK